MRERALLDGGVPEGARGYAQACNSAWLVLYQPRRVTEVMEELVLQAITHSTISGHPSGTVFNGHDLFPDRCICLVCLQ